MKDGWIGVDFDSTLAKYTKWKGHAHTGEPVPEMVTRVKGWLDEGKKVKILTARVATNQDKKDRDAAEKAIKGWCKEHLGQELEVTSEKDMFMTELWDDRAIQVKPNEGVPIGERVKFILLKVKNSKGTAVSGKWKDPGAKLYDQLLNAMSGSKGVIDGTEDPDETNVQGWPEFLKEAYLVAPVKDIKNSPHGITPFARSGCKFPHHTIKGSTLVLHKEGLKDAYKKAWRSGILHREVKSHLDRHFKELGMEVQFHHGDIYFRESKQEGPFEMSQLPETFQKLIKETHDLIMKTFKDKIKESQYKDLNKPDIVKELENSMRGGPSNWVGKSFINPNDKAFIFITDAKQDYKYYHTYDEGNNGHRLYKMYVKLLQDIEREIKEKVNNECKDWGLTFMLRGDPPDMIHQFEFEVDKGTTEFLYKHIKNKPFLEYDEECFEERFRNPFKFSFHFGFSIDNFHKIKVVFDTNTINDAKGGLTPHINSPSGMIFGKTGEIDNKTLQNRGHTDFTGTGKVIAIIDLDTKKRLTSSNMFGIFAFDFIGIDKLSSELIEEVRKRGFDNTYNSFSKAFETIPVNMRENFAQDNGYKFFDCARNFKVGEVLKKKCFMTVFGKNPSARDIKNNEYKMFARDDITKRQTKTPKHFIEENFSYIESFIEESLGIDLYVPEYAELLEDAMYFDEGKVKDFIHRVAPKVVKAFRAILLFFRKIFRSRRLRTAQTLADLMNWKGIKSSSPFIVLLGTNIMIDLRSNVPTLYESSDDNYQGLISSDEAIELIEQLEGKYNHKFIIVTASNFNHHTQIAGSGKMLAYFVKLSESEIRRLYPQQAERFLNSFSQKLNEYPTVVINLFKLGDSKGRFNKEYLELLIGHEYGHLLNSKNNRLPMADKQWEYPIRHALMASVLSITPTSENNFYHYMAYHHLRDEKEANNLGKVDIEKLCMHMSDLKSTPSGYESSSFAKIPNMRIPETIYAIADRGRKKHNISDIRVSIDFSRKIYSELLPHDKFMEVSEYFNRLLNTPEYLKKIVESTGEIISVNEKGEIMFESFEDPFELEEWEERATDDLAWIESFVQREGYDPKDDTAKQNLLQDPDGIWDIGPPDPMCKAEYKKRMKCIKDTGKDSRTTCKNCGTCKPITEAEGDEEPPPLEETSEEEPPNIEDTPIEEPVEPEEPVEQEEVVEPPTQEAPPPTPPPPQEKPKSLPKQRDAEESDKNGVRRKKLYIAFIEWCKAYNPKNTFGSVFDKDAFNITYPFVPQEMRYFYRLANPMLCVLGGDLTFFALAELRKLNAKNTRLNEAMIFAATPEDLRVFNRSDGKVYQAVEEGGQIKLTQVLGDTFDNYLQNMIKQGDILNAPLEESVEEDY